MSDEVKRKILYTDGAPALIEESFSLIVHEFRPTYYRVGVRDSGPIGDTEALFSWDVIPYAISFESIPKCAEFRHYNYWAACSINEFSGGKGQRAVKIRYGLNLGDLVKNN